jgi:hypothetical protein
LRQPEFYSEEGFLRSPHLFAAGIYTLSGELSMTYPYRPPSEDPLDESLPSQVSKTLLVESAVPTEHQDVSTTLLIESAVPSEHPPCSQTLLIQSAVPTDPPLPMTYPQLKRAELTGRSQVSKTLLMPDVLPTEKPYINTTLLKGTEKKIK